MNIQLRTIRVSEEYRLRKWTRIDHKENIFYFEPLKFISIVSIFFFLEIIYFNNYYEYLIYMLKTLSYNIFIWKHLSHKKILCTNIFNIIV